MFLKTKTTTGRQRGYLLLKNLKTAYTIVMWYWKPISNIHLSLAEMPLANGILRVDKNTSTENIQLHLGHYALANINGKIIKETRKVKGHDVQIINNGNTS